MTNISTTVRGVYLIEQWLHLPAWNLNLSPPVVSGLERAYYKLGFVRPTTPIIDILPFLSTGSIRCLLMVIFPRRPPLYYNESIISEESPVTADLPPL